MSATLEALSVAEKVALLVRPGAQRLGDPAAGAGRVSKATVTSAAQLLEVTGRARLDGPLPLLLSVNQEGGRLNALDWAQVEQLPGCLALGAAGDENLAELAGAAIGGQLRAAGLTWNLTPVCDLAGWPSASAVGTRAFGSDPEEVARLVAGFVRGLQSAGVAATAKHFPGLGGILADPHCTMPVADRLAPGALLPFRAAVDAGAACVMAGSHVVREIDDRPALVSPRAIGLLRDRLGFGGVVVSENLSIPAVHEPLGGLARAAVAAVAAGVDVVMLDSEISRGHQPRHALDAMARRRDGVIEALLAAVTDGVIGRQRVTDAAGRVLRLHYRFGAVPGAAEPGWAEANARAGEVASRIGGKSVAVVRGAHLLPFALPPGAALAVVRVPDPGQRRADSARHAPDLFPAMLGERHPVMLRLDAGCDVPASAGAVVVYGYDTRTGAAASSLAAAEAARLAGRGLVVAQVALGDVDDLAGSPADVLVAAFSPHRASVCAAASALLGDGRACGTVPVRGLPW